MTYPRPEEERRMVDREFDAISKKFGALEESITSLESEMRTHNKMGVGIEGNIARLQDEMKANTEVTTEVRNILTTFKTLGTFAKWISVIGAAVLSLLATWKGLWK